MSPMISALRIIDFALQLRASFVHPHRPPVEQRSIQGSDGGLGFRRLRHLDKCDTAGLARIPVYDDGDSFDGAMAYKNLSQLLLGYRDIKVPDKNVDQEFIPATDLPEFPLEIEAEFSKGDLERSPFGKASRYYRGCTFSACQPFGPLVTSNCTVWPS